MKKNQKKSYYKTINYQNLLLLLIKEKYFSLILGLAIFYFISFYSYNFIVNNSFFPKISFFVKTNKKNFVQNVQKQKNNNHQRIYTVKEGDDLWHIAEKFYGSGYNAYDISTTNDLDPLLPLKAGQKLIIPKITPKTPTTGEIASGIFVIKTNLSNQEKYIVQPGDSLSLIAQKVYGDLYAWPKILQANNLQNPDQIEVGMILNIPR